ncbi:MAG: hypothetical protein ACK5O2_16655, partial [Microthrixaceae bacterium]
MTSVERSSLATMLHSRLASRGQSGFVLGVVLAAMTVGLLLITALLSLSFATHRAALAQQEIARQQRAADGALETGVTRTRAGFNSSPIADPCSVVGPSKEVESVDFDWDTPSTGDDVTMELYCDEVIGNQAVTEGTVKLVGDEYTNSPLAGAFDWVGWPAWASAFSGATPPDAALRPSLVHSGDEPLLFNGSVGVHTGAAGILNTPNPPDAGAIAVAGNYFQQDDGYLGSAAERCGMLALGNPDLVGSVDTTRTAVVDSDASPTCGDGDFQATDVAIVPSGLPQTVPGCAPGGPGTIQTFQPGIYGPAAVDALNALFDGSCPDKVFNFTAGDYWFSAGGASDALEFDDATSAFVFGTLEGSGVAATCTPDAPGGVQVVFDGSSTFRHSAGNVSICGNPGAARTLVQAKEIPPEITWGAITSGTHPKGAANPIDFVNVENVIKDASGSEDAVGTVDCDPFNVACNLDFTVELSAVGSVPIDDLRLAWTSSEVPRSHLSNNRKVKVVLNTVSNGTKTCGPVLAGRTPGFISDIDLTGCTAGLSVADLDGASMNVTFTYDANTYLPNAAEPIKLSIRGLEMMVNARDVNATAATGAWGQWRDNSNVPGVLPGTLASGGAWARP